MEIPGKTQAHSVWNRPRLGEDNRTRARETYQGAAAQLKSELASASKESDPVDIYASVRELEILVNEAKDKYRDGRSKHTHAGARQWLESLSYHMVRFSRAFDTVPVHHQGYVNLAWGAIKFVLKAIIDRPVLIQKLCEALVAIADVLPRGDFNAELYPTNVMESALARLYSQMILFSLECVRWYNRSPLGRFWSTINGPFELHYKDLAQQIKLCSENIEALANSGRQAEARQSHELLRQQDCRLSALDAKLIEMHTGYEQTRADLQRLLQYASSHGTLLNSISIDTQAIIQRTFRIEFHQVLKFFTPKVHPDKALLRVQSLTMRNPTWTMPSHNTPRIQRHLADWVSSDRSSLLVVRVTLGQQKQARELAADVIKSLKTSAQTVLWSLSLYNTSERTITTSDVFKGIIFQLIHRLGPAVADFAEDLNLSKIDSPHTDHEWVDLICKLLSKVPDVFIVLETEDLNQVYQHDAEWADRFLQLLQGIVERVGRSGAKLKLLVVIYGGVVEMEEAMNGNYDLVETSLQVAVPVPPRLRHVAQRTALNTRGWRMQRPKI